MAGTSPTGANLAGPVTPVSWPAPRPTPAARPRACLCRPSTSFSVSVPQVVDGQAKPGHDTKATVSLRRLVSAIPAMPLQHLDPVAVGVGDEEEVRRQGAVAVEFLHRLRIEAFRGKAGMLGPDIGHHDGNMAVAVA